MPFHTDYSEDLKNEIWAFFISGEGANMTQKELAVHFDLKVGQITYILDLKMAEHIKKAKAG